MLELLRNLNQSYSEKADEFLYPYHRRVITLLLWQMVGIAYILFMVSCPFFAIYAWIKHTSELLFFLFVLTPAFGFPSAWMAFHVIRHASWHFHARLSE